MVSVCLSVSGDKQGMAGVGQGGQGRHPPIGPAGGPQQPSRWCLCGQCLGRFFQSLPVPCGVGDKQGRAARAAATGGRARCHFY